MKAIILTQETCPNCDALKMFIHATTKGVYDKSIEWVKKEDDESRFKTLVSAVDTQQTPTIIFVDGAEVVETVKGFSPARVKELLERYL